MQENQLTRYGAISKVLPFTTGKVFFLVSPSEAALNTLNENYPVDNDGVSRVYTTWASVLAACQASTSADAVIVSPLFTTAPTVQQIQDLNATGVVTLQAGANLPDGSYLAQKASLSLATATTNNIFTVTGRVQLLEIFGTVQTTTGSTASGLKFQAIPTVGSTTDLCVTSNIASLAIGGTVTITGTLATALTASVQGAIISQATPITIKAGSIAINTTATTTGNVAFFVRYKPLEPGAFVSGA